MQIEGWRPGVSWSEGRGLDHSVPPPVEDGWGWRRHPGALPPRPPAPGDGDPFLSPQFTAAAVLRAGAVASASGP